MPDREKVIEGLENLRETIRNATQYTFTSGGICAMNMKRIDNAIELLKEQEHKDRMYHALEDDWKRLKELLKEQKETIENREQEIRDKNKRLKERAEQVDSLLKKQEAVEPKTGHWIYKKYDDMFMCSSCEKYSIRNDYPYCNWCGAKMKQEGR